MTAEIKWIAFDRSMAGWMPHTHVLEYPAFQTSLCWTPHFLIALIDGRPSVLGIPLESLGKGIFAVGIGSSNIWNDDCMDSRYLYASLAEAIAHVRERVDAMPVAQREHSGRGVIVVDGHDQALTSPIPQEWASIKEVVRYVPNGAKVEGVASVPSCFTYPRHYGRGVFTDKDQETIVARIAAMTEDASTSESQALAMWAGRTRAALEAVVPVALWRRDHYGEIVGNEELLETISFTSMVAISNGTTLPGLPDELRHNVGAYLRSLPAYEQRWGNDQEPITIQQHDIVVDRVATGLSPRNAAT